MRKFIIIIIVFILLWWSFWYIKNNTDFLQRNEESNIWKSVSQWIENQDQLYSQVQSWIFLPQQDQSQDVFQDNSIDNIEILTGEEFALFLHDDWFTKEKFWWLEYLRNDPGWLNDIAECKKTWWDWYSQTCDEMEQELNEFIFPDYTILYSWFTVSVLDIDKVIWHEITIASWMKEFNVLNKYPRILFSKILTDTMFRNRATLDYIKEIKNKSIVNADICKAFISLEWQDWYSPVINIICKKWTKLISIYNNDRLPSDNWLDDISEVKQLLYDFRNDESLTNNENLVNDWKAFFDYYNNKIETNILYQKLRNETIENAINRFALK